MWCDVMWRNAVWCDVIWCDVMWCDGMWCDVMWCDVIWSDVKWCDVLLFYIGIALWGSIGVCSCDCMGMFSVCVWRYMSHVLMMSMCMWLCVSMMLCVAYEYACHIFINPFCCMVVSGDVCVCVCVCGHPCRCTDSCCGMWCQGWTAIMWAAEWGKTECVQLLWKAGAKLDIQNNSVSSQITWGGGWWAADG